MPTNPYFNLHADSGHTNEQDLIHDLTAEAIQITGIDVKYLPRTLQKKDTLFGEDVLSAFTSNYTIEMYIDSVESFEGDGDLLAKFGLDVKDELNLTVAVRRFEQLLADAGINKPREGDLIYFPLSKGLFEIKFVEDEAPFYPLGTLPTYKLRCQLFDYSSEKFTTGDADIDNVKRVDPEADLDPFADNVDIEKQADAILDFDVDNPFGRV